MTPEKKFKHGSGSNVVELCDNEVESMGGRQLTRNKNNDNFAVGKNLVLSFN